MLSALHVRNFFYCIGFPSLRLLIYFDSCEASLFLGLTVVRGHCVLFVGLCFCDVGWLQLGDCEAGSFEIQVAVEASGIKSACKDSRAEYLGKMSYRVKIMLFSAIVSRETSGCNKRENVRWGRNAGGFGNGNQCGFLVAEVNAEERLLRVSGCRCLGR